MFLRDNVTTRKSWWALYFFFPISRIKTNFYKHFNETAAVATTTLFSFADTYILSSFFNAFRDRIITFMMFLFLLLSRVLTFTYLHKHFTESEVWEILKKKCLGHPKILFFKPQNQYTFKVFLAANI